MTVIVNTGTTLTVTNSTSLTITGSDTVAAGGVVNGEGSIVGSGSLLNLGTITSDQPAGVLTVNSATLTNQGTVFANNASLAIQSGVDLTNLSSGTLTGGVWESSGTGTLDFQVIGSSLKLYYGATNGPLSLVASATDATYTTGLAGLWTIGPATLGDFELSV